MEARGLDVDQMAGRLDMARESVYRCPRERSRIWENVQAWSDAIGLDHWQDLTRPPGQPSVDARMEQIPAEFRDAIIRLVGGKAS